MDYSGNEKFATYDYVGGGELRWSRWLAGITLPGLVHLCYLPQYQAERRTMVASEMLVSIKAEIADIIK